MCLTEMYDPISQAHLDRLDLAPHALTFLMGVNGNPYELIILWPTARTRAGPPYKTKT